MAKKDINWRLLGETYPAKLISALRRHFAGGPFEIRARQLSTEANTKDGTALSLLEELSTLGFLEIKKLQICPCEQEQFLTQEQSGQDVCVHCERAFEVDIVGRPTEVTAFVHEAQETRDVRWMLALHGMNTTGGWQEEFNWLLSKTYGRSVPIAIFKYGIVRPGAVLKFRQRALIRRLTGRIQRLSRETVDSGFGGVPDVIAHSFGTWLLGHALENDPTLRVGRVILTGCILRPDFDWNSLIVGGQVQVVLCHSAAKDFWAGLSHYLIPDSGPSGRYGFNDRVHVMQAEILGGGHSDFFKEGIMPTLYDTVWHPFLTCPIGDVVAGASGSTNPDWKQAWWPFRATLLRVALLGILAATILIVSASLVMGLIELWRLFL